MGRGRSNFEVHDTNMDVKGNSDESSERKEKSYRESFHLLSEYINNHEQNLDRNMDGQGHSGKVSDRNEEHVIGN